MAGGTYGGIESYRKTSKYKKKKKSKNSSGKPSKKGKKRRRKEKAYRNVFLIVLFSLIIAVIGIKSSFIKDTKKLSDESIINYITETDEMSRDKLQLSWQEIASIDLALNNGKEKLDNKDNIKRICDKFFKYDENEKVIGINSFKTVVNEFELSSKEKSDAQTYLIKIEKNYLNRDLINNRSKMKFISSISAYAKKGYEDYDILPSVTIAQAILESGWGESTLSSKYNNLFGIKADDRWSGKRVNMETKENYSDIIQGEFRAYEDYESSIEDHGKFLSENSRYKDNGIFNKKTYEGQTQALEDAGYATVKDENGEAIYSDLLVEVIRNNNLMLYDTEVQR